MKTRSQVPAELKAAIVLGVLQRIHIALASIESRRLNGNDYSGWTTSEEMDADYSVLCEMRGMVCAGEDIFTTQHSRLFVMRELVVAGADFVLADGHYVLSEKAAWFTCGAISIRLRETSDGKSVICTMYPLGHEDGDDLSTCEASYCQAREVSAAVPV